jgi:hypothetical protein
MLLGGDLDRPAAGRSDAALRPYDLLVIGFAVGRAGSIELGLAGSALEPRPLSPFC